MRRTIPHGEGWAMDDARASVERLLAIEAPCGSGRARFVTGIGTWALEGLSDAQLAALSGRWGAFLEPEAGDSEHRVRLLDAGVETWLPAWVPGERYRIEGTITDKGALARSYHFAVLAGRE